MAPAHGRRLAVILSGGGARGAYEAGVLWYLFDELTRQRGAPPRIDILCGTSVGAINSAFLAAHLADPVLGVRRLVEVWTGMQLHKVLGFDLRQTLRLPRIVLGGREGTGLFDASPLAQLVQREVPWRAVSRSLRKGLLQALSVSATEVSTGRTVIFLQTGPKTELPTHAPPRTLIRSTYIGPLHALASAAIPLLFPPVRIGNELYVDGAVRQSTPVAPAIRLGATHVLVVGTSRLVRGVSHPGPERRQAPSVTFLLGKMMNALLLDHLDSDIGMVNLLNNIATSGAAAYGPGFVERFNEAAFKRGAHLLRPISTLIVRPTESIGRLASETLRRGRMRRTPLMTRQLLKLLDAGVGDDADLASYLLFDGEFARALIDLGRADAQARRFELQSFLGSAEEDSPPANEPDGSDSVPPSWSPPPPAVG
ncbi:MAG TPA: patatin-like phospholipase family protein [Polyangiaceae bacterium]